MLFLFFGNFRNDGLAVFIQNPTKTPEGEQPEAAANDSDEKINSKRKRKKNIERLSSVAADGSIQKPKGNPIPICHLPFESLTSIPTMRFTTTSSTEKEDSNEQAKDNNDFTDSSVIISGGARFLELCQTAPRDKFLDRVNLIVIDNVHESLRDNNIRKDLLEILKIIR